MDSRIETSSGRRVELLDPKAESICILDIAHSLARIGRFNGHCTDFYSVAQHSVLVSNLLAETDREKEGLLHDAAEAYIGDVVSPLKSVLPEYLVIERRFEKLIARIFRLEYTLSTGWDSDVKEADLTALFIEKKVLLPHSGYWPHLAASVKDVKDFEYFTPLPPEKAEDLFMKRYKELFHG